MDEPKLSISIIFSKKNLTENFGYIFLMILKKRISFYVDKYLIYL